MAKGKKSESPSGSNDAKELQKIADSLFKVLQTTSASSKEQVRINRELLKVLSLLENGFVSSAKEAKELISKVESEGYAITDEFITKWAKERKLSKSDLDYISKKFKEIEKLNLDIIDDAKSYNSFKKTTKDLLDDEIDLTAKILGNYDQILEAVQASKKQIGGFGSGLGEVAKTMSQMGKDFNIETMFIDSSKSAMDFENLLAKVNSDIKGIVSSTSGELFSVDLNFNPLTDQLDKEIAKVIDNISIEKNMRIDALRSEFNENEKLQVRMMRKMAAQKLGLDIDIDVDTGQIKTATGLFEEGSVEFEKLANTLDSYVISSGLKTEVIASLNEIVDLISLGDKLTEEQYQTFKKLIQPLGAAGQILADTNLQYQTLLDNQQDELMNQGKLIKGLSQYSNTFQSFESVIGEVGNSFEFINSLMPSGISEFIGLSKVSSELTKSHTKGVQDFAQKLSEGVKPAEAMQTYFKAFEPALNLALSPMLLIVTASILLFKFVSGITDKYKEMASEMKISLGQAKDLLQVQLDTLTSQKNQFASLKDIQDVQTAMIGSSGKMFDLSTKGAKELSIQLVEVGKYFGYGTEQAVTLQKTFEQLGADKKLAMNLQKNLGTMSEMAGLSPQIVAQDLIDSAAEVSTYFAGMPDKAAKAAINIRRMGMSLKQAGSIAQNMVGNMEGFMTDMYELQAMSAGGIDFSGAFEKGLMGDIEGMTKDIMNNIGTTSEFNHMDYLTRMKIAKTLGMSVDELGKSVMLNEKMAGLGEDQQKYLQANLDRMGDISNLSEDDIKNKLQQLQSTDRLAIAWDKIKGVLLKSLLPLVEAFADGIDAISPILDILIMGFKGIGSILKWIGPLIQVIFRPFKWGFDLLSQMTGRMDEFGDSVNSTGKYVSEVAKVLIGIGEIIGGIFIAKKFGLLSNGLGEFASKIPIIGKLFGSADASAKKTAMDSTAVIQELSTSVQSSMGSMAESVGSTMRQVATSIKETFSEITTGAKTVSADATKVSSDVATSLQKDTAVVSTATTKMNAEVASSVQKTTSNVAASTSKMASDVQNSVVKTQAVVKSGGKMSFMSADRSKQVFGTIGEIASKTFAIMAMRSATSFLTMKKDGEEQTGQLTDHMGGMFDMAFMGVGSLLTSYLSEGIEKVFSKKIEKHIEGKLENPIKKLSKTFGSVEKSGEKSFDGIEKKGKGVFGRIVDFAKKILPGSTTSMTGTFDNLAEQGKQVLKPIEQTQDVVKKIKSKSEKTVESTVKSKKINVPSPESPIKDMAEKTGSGFDTFKNVLKSVWDGIKTVLTDIVKFISTTIKELSSGIGEAIKNILKGIGDGLSSFKGSALKGAATLVILSGALWITSKALQNFASVKWEDIGKAGATLGGLAAVALILGSASAQMIIGAVAIALLGASLIPAAYALNKFNDVEWSSLAKAGVALVGLGVAAGILGGMVPLMLLGAVGIAALGTSMIPMAIAMKMFNEVDWDSLGKAGAALVGFGLIAAGFGLVAPIILAGALTIGTASVSLMMFAGSILAINLSMKGLDVTPMLELGKSLWTVASIPVSSLVAVSAAIIGLGGAIAAFNSLTAISGIGKAISSAFGGDVVKDLEKLGSLAEPLYIVQKVLVDLNDALFVLAETLSNLDLSGIEKLKDIPKIGIDAVVKEKVQPIVENFQGVQQDSTQVKIAPVQSQVPKVSTPKKEAVAQDKLLNQKSPIPSESGMTMEKTASTQVQFNPYQVNNQREDTYEEDTIPDNQETNMLLKKLIYLFELSLKKDLVVQMDGQRVGNIVNKLNNKA